MDPKEREFRAFSQRHYPALPSDLYPDCLRVLDQLELDWPEIVSRYVTDEPAPRPMGPWLRSVALVALTAAATLAWTSRSPGPGQSATEGALSSLLSARRTIGDATREIVQTPDRDELRREDNLLFRISQDTPRGLVDNIMRGAGPNYATAAAWLQEHAEEIETIAGEVSRVRFDYTRPDAQIDMFAVKSSYGEIANGSAVCLAYGSYKLQQGDWAEAFELFDAARLFCYDLEEFPLRMAKGTAYGNRFKLYSIVADTLRPESLDRGLISRAHAWMSSDMPHMAGVDHLHQDFLAVADLVARTTVDRDGRSMFSPAELQDSDRSLLQAMGWVDHGQIVYDHPPLQDIQALFGQTLNWQGMSYRQTCEASKAFYDEVIRVRSTIPAALFISNIGAVELARLEVESKRRAIQYAADWCKQGGAQLDAPTPIDPITQQPFIIRQGEESLVIMLEWDAPRRPAMVEVNDGVVIHYAAGNSADTGSPPEP